MTAEQSQKPDMETHKFEADVNELLKLVIHSLYSHKEIFLRELVSNASDALERLRFRAVTEPALLGDDPALEVRIIPDAASGTLTIEDTGVGMTHDELVEHLGTVARSGSRAFLDKLRDAERKDMSLIGQFGVGFYSAYLVADRVDVVSRAAGASQAFRWSSDARESFTVTPADRAARGTQVIVHLKEDQKQYLEEWELRDLVQRYSDYVSYPIRLQVTKTTGSGEDKKSERVFENINRAVALWQRPAGEISREQYNEFYKHITHDFEDPLAYTHFKFEGTQLFAGILFIPKNAPFDLAMPKTKRGIRLYVKRVFIMEDCEELLPPWLRFVRGVVDSDDLPLNVSRELLQDSAVVRTIRKQVVKKTLERLEQLSSESPDDFVVFWNAFGAIVKEGIAIDTEYRERIAKIARFRSTHGPELTTLSDYVSRMKDAQPAIYYALGDSTQSIESSPYLEALRKRGYEVLLLSDPVDEWATEALDTFEGKPLLSAMRADLKLDESDDEKLEREARAAELKSLCERFQHVLKDRVSEVRLSERLTESPCCLVVPEGGHHATVERLLRASGHKIGAQKRILEINPAHPVIGSIRALAERDPLSVDEWVETLYDQAVLTEGGKVEDPNRFAKRIVHLLQEVSRRHLETGTPGAPPQGAAGT